MLLCHLPPKRSSSTGPSTSRLVRNIETFSNTEIHADQEKNAFTTVSESCAYIAQEIAASDMAHATAKAKSSIYAQMA